MTMKSVVIHSGGQDSTTVLGVALRESEVDMVITYQYGQKHTAEVGQAMKICDRLNLNHSVIDLTKALENMKSSALLTAGDTTKPHPYLKDLPASFVPVRNALFLTVAYGIAMERQCGEIYAGMCETDYSGYPDCRRVFIDNLNITLDQGYESNIEIITPVMYLDKADTFHLAHELGMLDMVIDYSMTCYDGNRTMNEWGMGCGKCPACVLREKGWNEYKTRYQAA